MSRFGSPNDPFRKMEFEHHLAKVAQPFRWPRLANPLGTPHNQDTGDERHGDWEFGEAQRTRWSDGKEEEAVFGQAREVSTFAFAR